MTLTPAEDWSMLQARAHGVAVEHGFWEGDLDNAYAKIALMHSELSEALEVLREGHYPTDWWLRPGDRKPEGLGPEMADVVIRVLDFCERYEINLHDWVVRKMEFNKTRPRMHGKEA